MSLIEKLQKISAKIFQETLKTYHFNDVIKHKNAKPHNLVQYLSLYPNKGYGFHVRRKGWPKNMYVRVTSSDYKSNRLGKIRGIQYLGTKPVWKMPKRITGVSNRGIWQYEVGQATQIKLDNDLVYTPADFKAYRQTRQNWKPKLKTNPQASQQSAKTQQGEQVQEGQEGQEPQQSVEVAQQSTK